MPYDSERSFVRSSASRRSLAERRSAAAAAA